MLETPLSVMLCSPIATQTVAVKKKLNILTFLKLEFIAGLHVFYLGVLNKVATEYVLLWCCNIKAVTV